MDIRPIETTPGALTRYRALFEACFPSATHLREAYLHWLYAQNPCGVAVGFDAWAGEQLAAHYVCIPVDALVFGRPVRILLSLNTATHPSFQGKGLFTKLAEATYERGSQMGFGAVYGVANANSTPGFLRKLGFALVRPLDALVGFGRIDPGEPAPAAEVSFRRLWSAESLRWRMSNPVRPYRMIQLDKRRVGAYAPTGRLGFYAWDELTAPPGMDAERARASLRPLLRLHLGLRPASWRRPATWVPIPQRLRPSPLNLIYRPLAARIAAPADDSIVLGQLDFDAF